jgi:hypothetical protein
MAPIDIGCRADVIALLMGLAAPILVKGDQIDDFITAQMRRLRIPGVSLAIVRDARITKVQGTDSRISSSKRRRRKTPPTKSARLQNSSPPPQ